MRSRSDAKKAFKYLAVLALLVLLPMAQAYAAPSSYSIALDAASSPLPVLVQGWLGFALIAILAVLAFAAVIYALAPMINSQASRSWARAQIYNGLATGLLLVIFTLVIFVFFLDPRTVFHALGVLPPACSQYLNIFEIASCDMGQFNSIGIAYFDALFTVAITLGFVPGFQVTVGPNSGVSFLTGVLSAISPATGVQENRTYSLGNINTQVQFSTASIVSSSVTGAISMLFGVLLMVMLVTSVLSFVVGASLLLLSFLVVLGLVSRALGFTRTFGGTMIAAGLGIGIVLPLMVCLMYGYIATAISAGSVTPQGLFFQILGFFLTLAEVSIGVTSGTSLPTAASSSWIYQLILLAGGLTFVPYLTLSIVDAFVVDFSKAIGEQMVFMQLFTGLI